MASSSDSKGACRREEEAEVCRDPEVGGETVIDLTGLGSDEEPENGLQEAMDVDGLSKKVSMVKFTYVKKVRASRLQIVREGMAEKIHYSLFSEVSKQHFEKLIHESKETYVGESRNPFFGNALFAAQNIDAGDFICLYLGRRMPWCEANAILDAGKGSVYMLYITDGVVIDGDGLRQGGCMANHSCSPNAELQYDNLPGYEHAPIALLRALDRIEIGDEIEVNYHMWDPVYDPLPNLADKSTYVECKCLRENCCHVLKLIE